MIKFFTYIPKADCVEHCLKCEDSSANQRCTRCKAALYCNADCQKAHWKTHKPDCNRVHATNGKYHYLKPTKEHLEVTRGIFNAHNNALLKSGLLIRNMKNFDRLVEVTWYNKSNYGVLLELARNSKVLISSSNGKIMKKTKIALGYDDDSILCSGEKNFQVYTEVELKNNHAMPPIIRDITKKIFDLEVEHTIVGICAHADGTIDVAAYVFDVETLFTEPQKE